MTTWAQHVGKFAKKNNMKLGQAMKNSKCKSEWKKIKISGGDLNGNTDSTAEPSVKSDEPSVAPEPSVKSDEPSVVPDSSVKSDEPSVAPVPSVESDEPSVAPVPLVESADSSKSIPGGRRRRKSSKKTKKTKKNRRSKKSRKNYPFWSV